MFGNVGFRMLKGLGFIWGLGFGIWVEVFKV